MEKRVEQEAFVYLWYDASNKKYYLGKHKGTPDDGYTHSSTIWESFTKDTIPEGVSRRILAYGTNEEMCILEHELLVDRKKRCWDRYYNNSLGDPRYVDTSGENHPQWKGGIKVNDPVAYMKEYNREYHLRNREKLLAKNKEYYIKEYYPRKKEEILAQKKEYYLRNKEEINAKKKEYYHREIEKHKEYHREYYLRNKEKILAQKKERLARKKAERQGEGTLDRFM